MGNTTFAIGCLVQWYEIDILQEYVDSLISALSDYSFDFVHVDFKLVMNEQLEEYDGKQLAFYDIPDRFTSIVTQLLGKCVLSYTWTYDLFTIADYRRKFNLDYSKKVDVLIWGETDMLAPKSMFIVLNALHQQVGTVVGKYVATFATCKMWDDSWKQLEHIAFTDKPFVANDYISPWSVKYTMNKDEMDLLNGKYDEIVTTCVKPIKFNGCGLVISSAVVLAGVNIPESIFFVHEDSAFMKVLAKWFPNIPQYHFSNILLVHNRNHPQKRNHVKGEDGDTLNKRRRSNDWYVKANLMCETNYKNIYTPNFIPYTWDNVFDNSK